MADICFLRSRGGFSGRNISVGRAVKFPAIKELRNRSDRRRIRRHPLGPEALGLVCGAGHRDFVFLASWVAFVLGYIQIHEGPLGAAGLSAAGLIVGVSYIITFVFWVGYIGPRARNPDFQQFLYLFRAGFPHEHLSRVSGKRMGRLFSRS